MKNNVSFKSDLAKFGIGVFETIKVLEYPLDLDKHINRMVNSIDLLDIKCDLNKDDLYKIVEEYIKDNKIKQKALRITVFDEGYNISIREIIYNEQSYNEGISLKISPIVRGESILHSHKTTNYFENIYTKKDANKNDYFDGIFINSKGQILETSMSNIFFIKDDRIITPKSELPILNGIMKSNIKDICKKLNIKFEESIIDTNQINTFDYCFISNSLMGAMKVNNIEDTYYKNKNEIFNKIFNEIRNMESNNE